MVTVMITRPIADADALQALCLAHGLTPIWAPIMSIVPVTIPDPLPNFTAVAFNSANAVRQFGRQYDLSMRGFKVFAVGEVTAKACIDQGWDVTATAQNNVVSLAELISHDGTKGPVLQPRGEHHAGDLRGVLAGHGIDLVPMEIYHAEAASDLPQPAREALTTGLDWVTLLSPRSAMIFETLVAQAGLSAKLTSVQAAVFSPAVAAALSPAKWQNIAVAATPDVTDLIDIIRS